MRSSASRRSGNPSSTAPCSVSGLGAVDVPGSARSGSDMAPGDSAGGVASAGAGGVAVARVSTSAGVGVWWRSGGHGPSSRVTERIRYIRRGNINSATTANSTASTAAPTRTRPGPKRPGSDRGAAAAGATVSSAGAELAPGGEAAPVGEAAVALGEGGAALGDGAGAATGTATVAAWTAEGSAARSPGVGRCVRPDRLRRGGARGPSRVRVRRRR
ncbi:hypothetical protein [Micromonospora endophytica]|uniref:hypothetical protein n=1 Tax=Micromonospora endophytica TaxID=515350 RepID=UPI001BB3A5BE|nr:hypothetical protein [Micromonospora endophytica]